MKLKFKTEFILNYVSVYLNFGNLIFKIGYVISLQNFEFDVFITTTLVPVLL